MMDQTFQVFDWQRIFVGEAPLLFLAEIIFRTAIMYVYTIFLLRILGKRGMGQLSSLELAIIIAFGSAVGDPMLYDDVPVTYGMLAITVIALLQIGIEKLVNSNKKLEVAMDGEPNLVIDNGILQYENMLKDNLSKADVFRFLRIKDITHLGQVHKAFFETTGQLSVIVRSPEDTKAGLSVLPINLMRDENEFVKHGKNKEEGMYACSNCGYVASLASGGMIRPCPACKESKWVPAIE